MSATTSAVSSRTAGAAHSVRMRPFAAIGFELRRYYRSPDTVFFTFLFPIMMLGIFGAAFDSMGDIGTLPDGTGGVSMAAYYLPGLVAAGMFLSGVQNMASDVAQEKFDGWLRRLGSTPIRPLEYFIGKAGMLIITALAQTALLVAFAVVVFGISVPTEPERWLTFAWLFLLGLPCMTLLGVALAAVPRTARSITAVILPPVLLLQFISGVYLQFTMLPAWLQDIASVFPLKWLAQGMRSVFLPEHFEAQERSGSWDLGWVAIWLAVWLIVGLVLTRMTFRWQRRS